MLITLGWSCCSRVVLVALVVSGPIVDAACEAIGIGETGLTVWNVAKWPVSSSSWR